MSMSASDVQAAQRSRRVILQLAASKHIRVSGGAWQTGIIPDSAVYPMLSTSVFLNNFAADVPTSEAMVMATSPNMPIDIMKN